ncbi:MAG: hypothetical protein PWR29_1459 [Methanolobus sp.]|jgi:hypothetical protein|nr:hypothetical protein [Methanolobus sp.]MDK2834809.1 hypothetical protein [Methanolobus sp.]MDK2912502.1 hypothetical protein [Methanolobus sp.]
MQRNWLLWYAKTRKKTTDNGIGLYRNRTVQIEKVSYNSSSKDEAPGNHHALGCLSPYESEMFPNISLLLHSRFAVHFPTTRIT